MMVVVSGFLGFCGTLEMNQSILLQKLNFLHMKYNQIYFERVLEDTPIEDNLEQIKQDLLMIRAQPISCLEQLGYFDKLMMKSFGTYRAVELCEDDIKLADNTLEMIDNFSDGEISEEALMTGLMVAVKGFQSNDEEFQPLVEKSVNYIFNFVLALLVVGSVSIVTFATFIAKSIKNDYRRLWETERALTENQAFLSATLTNLSEMKEAAETSSRAKSSFLANMSHEIRTPLNAIIGFTSIMVEQMFGPVGDERYEEYLKDIHSSGLHLSEILGDILDLAKIESGEMMLNETAVDAREIVEDSTKIFYGMAEEAGITISEESAKDMPLLFADELRVKQIIINLISNALKFTPKGGHITVGAYCLESGTLRFFVKDDGEGISKEKLEQVLEPFVQVKGGNPTPYDGVGLGLSISKILAELHEGKLWIRSELKKGTEVHVDFPAYRSVHKAVA